MARRNGRVVRRQTGGNRANRRMRREALRDQPLAQTQPVSRILRQALLSGALSGASGALYVN